VHSPIFRANGARGRTRIATAVVAVFATALGGFLASGSAVADGTGTTQQGAAASVVAHGAKLGAGTYIVQLQNAPASTYSGGVAGYVATRPKTGHQLNAHSTAVKRYAAHLVSTQQTLLHHYGLHALHSYTVAYNGFAATLTAKQATALSVDKGVARLSKDRTLKIQGGDTLTSKGSVSYLKVDGDTGLWSTFGGPQNVGTGVVIGEIDTGITPDNPSFAGDPLQTTPSTTVPWLDDSSGTPTVTYDKSDGTTFKSAEVPSGPGWNSDTSTALNPNSDYSTKIVGAQFFDAGWLADKNQIATTGEYRSPRDGDDHGSHTSSTAAGDYGVDATVENTNGTRSDYGTIAGLAPAAKIAMYKACWSAPDPDNDGCDEADLLSAINQATSDGVDVINYSIGGDSAQTIYSPTDEAFLNAAIAGIFVAAAGGNAGPDASTLDNASPWETTVAASTIPSYEATAKLGNGREYVGASITVAGVATANPANPPRELTAPLADATTVRKSGVSSASAIDCRTGSLDPKKARGKVIVCDRDSIISRLEMSATVAAAGGVGMILTNTRAGDVDLDQHSVPTIHVDEPSRAAIHNYAATSSATVTFIPWNAIALANPAKATPVPQIAGFSSRGPVTAAGEDTLKPDIAAPGVSILAAYADDSHGQPQWGFDSGTSMATPHIAGLAAIYLTAHPMATPAEIKSAMMTTATNTKTSSGAAMTNPFVQGAGEVDPSRFLNPGLLYLAGKNDWESYINGTGEGFFREVAAINPSQLNQPSIAVGSFAGSTTITRTLTAQAAGTWDLAPVSIPGITTIVSPTSLTFSGAGDAQSYSVTFIRTTAPLHSFATGSLTWTNSADATQTVRIPLAVQPSNLPSSVSGSGTNGHANGTVSLTSDYPLHVYGLAPRIDAPNIQGQNVPWTAHFAVASSRDPSDPVASTGDRQVVLRYNVGSATTYARFSETTTTSDPTSDLDLFVLYSRTYSGTDPNGYSELAASATPSESESVSLNRPPAGHYLVVVDPYVVATGGVNTVVSSYQVSSATGSGFANVTPSVLHGTLSGVQRFQVRWGGLQPNTSYLGVVQYGATARSLVNVTTGTASTSIEQFGAPVLTGAGSVGAKLTASGGTWDVPNADLAIGYQWSEDGTDIPGATSSTFTPKVADFGHSLCIVTTAHLDGVSTASTPSCITVKAATAVQFSFAHTTVARGRHAVVTVIVGTNPHAQLDGSLIIVVSGHVVKPSSPAALSGSGSERLTFLLPLMAKGKHHVTIGYSGGSQGVPSRSAAHIVKVS
jgi:subtilisin family serine protease